MPVERIELPTFGLQNRYSTDVVGSRSPARTSYIDAKGGGRAAHDPRVHGGGGRLLGKDVVELEKRCARLEAEIAERDRLEQERGQRGLRAVPSPPAMIA